MYSMWAAILISMVPAQGIQSKPDLSLYRRAFAKAMMRLTEGMSDKDVLEILGQPDEIRKKQDLGPGWPTGIKEMWCYGTRQHLGFPTFGQAYFDLKGKVLRVFGNKGFPDKDLMAHENEVRSLLEILDQAPSLRGWDYDPLRVIKAVNSLQPLGKRRALAVIDEYLRVSPDYNNDARLGLFLVLRVLFDVPADPGYMPRMLVGSPWPAEPNDSKLVPRFPVLLDHDIPLLLVSGYLVGGVQEQVENHVEYFRQVGQLRAKPLTPPDNPTLVLVNIVHSKQWIYGADRASPDSNHGKSLLTRQLLRLIKPLYRTRADFTQYENRPGTAIDLLWERTVKEVSEMRLQWDAVSNNYRTRGKETDTP